MGQEIEADRRPDLEERRTTQWRGEREEGEGRGDIAEDRGGEGEED
jgi:hypothetical protein